MAVALYLGHRQSIDLDFFSRGPALDLEVLRGRLREVRASTIGVTDVTLSVRIGPVPVDFVRYPYKALARFSRGPQGVRLASIRDLAVMKLAAIARRGERDRVFLRGLTQSKWKQIRGWFEPAAASELNRRTR